MNDLDTNGCRGRVVDRGRQRTGRGVVASVTGQLVDVPLRGLVDAARGGRVDRRAAGIDRVRDLGFVDPPEHATGKQQEAGRDRDDNADSMSLLAWGHLGITARGVPAVNRRCVWHCTTRRSVRARLAFCVAFFHDGRCGLTREEVGYRSTRAPVASPLSVL